MDFAGIFSGRKDFFWDEERELQHSLGLHKGGQVKKHSKTLIWALFFAFIPIILLSCGGSGGGGSSSSPSPTSNEVSLTGNFTGGTHANASWFNRVFASFTKKALALDPTQVSKVLIFSAGSYSYQAVNVSNGTFSVNVPRSNPIGMIFVGSNDEYLGYLYLKNNIASLPMSRVKSSVATIDLGALSSSGLVVEPSNNPLGNEIPLTSQESKALAHFNGLFASIIKNPDIDGNGKIDLLEGKKFYLLLVYYIDTGKFGSELTPSMNEFKINLYWMTFYSSTSNCPDTVTVTGPQASPFSSPQTVNRRDLGTPYCSHQYVSNSNPGPVTAGEYRVEYPTGTLTFIIPDQTPILSDSIMMRPTVTLKDDGTVQKISWIYCPANGSGEVVNPESLIQNILINRTVAGVMAPTIIIPSTSVTEVDLSDKGIIWDQVEWIGTAYDDVYGNAYCSGWLK
jgi:hypothetical protein